MLRIPNIGSVVSSNLSSDKECRYTIVVMEYPYLVSCRLWRNGRSSCLQDYYAMLKGRITSFEIANLTALYHEDPVTFAFHAQLALAAPRLFKDDRSSPSSTKTNREDPASPLPCWLLATLDHYSNTRLNGVSDEEAINNLTAYRPALVQPYFLGRVRSRTAAVRQEHLPTLLRSPPRFASPEGQGPFSRPVWFEAKRMRLRIKGEALKIALDTKPIRGRGAVQDTFNLLARRASASWGAFWLKPRAAQS